MFPAFGGEPHDSEFKRRTSVGSDDWELDSYVRQLENPKVMTQPHRNQRKTLTEILDGLPIGDLKMQVLIVGMS